MKMRICINTIYYYNISSLYINNIYIYVLVFNVDVRHNVNDINNVNVNVNDL